VAWLSKVLGREVSGSLVDAVRDGEALCDALDALRPGSIAGECHRGTTQPFKRRENIGLFIQACRGLGVTSVFETRDVDDGDAAKIARCLASLASKLGATPLVLPEPPAAKLAGFETVHVSTAAAEASPLPPNARGRRAHGSFLAIAAEEKAAQAAPRRTPPSSSSSSSTTTSKPARRFVGDTDICRDNCLVHWPPRHEADHRFDQILASLPDDDFKAQVADFKLQPGMTLKLEYRPHSGCVLLAEDDDGCCQLELEW